MSHLGPENKASKGRLLSSKLSKPDHQAYFEGRNEEKNRAKVNVDLHYIGELLGLIELYLYCL